MPGRRRLAAAAVVLLADLLVAGCTPGWHAASASRWQFVEVDHEISDQPGGRGEPVALSGDGPPPGVMREDWRIELPTSQTQPRLHLALAGGSLIVHAGDGVTGYDAATGARRWHYREPGRRMWAATTADTVVLATESAGRYDPDSARLVGIDAGSGEILWAQRLRWRLGRGPTLLTVADGAVPMLDLDEVGRPYRLVGLDPSTGQPVWEADREFCGFGVLDPPAASDGSVILVQDVCRAGGSWQAYDPATGRLLWTTTWPAWALPRDMRVVAGAVLSQIPASQLQLVDADGATRTMATDPLADLPIGFWLPVDEDAGGSGLVDVRTGATASHGWPSLDIDQAAPTLAADGTLYALDGRGPVPGLVVGDPGAGPGWMPLPGSADVLGYPVWAATADGRLLLARQPRDGPMRILAYVSEPTAGPVHLGGVPTEDWPDPCQLRVDGAVRAEAVPSAAMMLGTVEVPRQACMISLQDPDSGGLAHVEVEIVWVAASAAQASNWLAGPPGPDGVEEVVDDGTRLLARIGRVLVELRGYARADVDPLAVLEAIAGQLSDY